MRRRGVRTGDHAALKITGNGDCEIPRAVLRSRQPSGGVRESFERARPFQDPAPQVPGASKLLDERSEAPLQDRSVENFTCFDVFFKTSATQPAGDSSGRSAGLRGKADEPVYSGRRTCPVGAHRRDPLRCLRSDGAALGKKGMAARLQGWSEDLAVPRDRCRSGSRTAQEPAARHRGPWEGIGR